MDRGGAILSNWNQGEPPAPGWYQASHSKDERTWRWWDGKCWSRPAFPCHTAEQAGGIAEMKEITPLGTAGLLWREGVV